MRKSFFFFAFLLVLILACTQAPYISGKLDLVEDSDNALKVYLLDPLSFDSLAMSYTGKVIDSSEVATDGSFAFVHPPKTIGPGIFEIAVQKKEEPFANKLVDENPEISNYAPVIWETRQLLFITAKSDRFQSSFSLENPSVDNKSLLALRDVRLNSYRNYLKNKQWNVREGSQLLDQEAAHLAYQSELMRFADTTRSLPAALLAVRWASPEGDYERMPEFLVSQCEKWQGEHADDLYVKGLCAKADKSILPVLKGDRLEDFSMPLASGASVPVHQMLGKKLTLLDVWASWCAPCRLENRHVLVPLWEKYHERGFQIVAYALENNEATWKAAIEKDGTFRWPNASHLQGDENPLMESLRIKTIPANFLVDEEGTVLAKNLHGDALVKFVEDYLQE